MKTRQLLRFDLPKRRWAATSLHIPVLFNEKKRFVCDIHYANDELCYLEGAQGIPTKISKLQFLVDGRSRKDILNEIHNKQQKRKELTVKDKKLLLQIMQLKNELKESNS